MDRDILPPRSAGPSAVTRCVILNEDKDRTEAISRVLYKVFEKVDVISDVTIPRMMDRLKTYQQAERGMDLALVGIEMVVYKDINDVIQLVRDMGAKVILHNGGGIDPIRKKILAFQRHPQDFPDMIDLTAEQEESLEKKELSVVESLPPKTPERQKEKKGFDHVTLRSTREQFKKSSAMVTRVFDNLLPGVGITTDQELRKAHEEWIASGNKPRGFGNKALRIIHYYLEKRFINES